MQKFEGTNHAEWHTEVERSQHITQTDTHVYGQSYVANTSSVDGRLIGHSTCGQTSMYSNAASRRLLRT